MSYKVVFDHWTPKGVDVSGYNAWDYVDVSPSERFETKAEARRALTLGHRGKDRNGVNAVFKVVQDRNNPRRGRKLNPIRSKAQYRLARAAASGYATGTAMSKAAARKMLAHTPGKLRSKLAGANSKGMIPAKVIVGRDGTMRVFVNPRHLAKANPNVLDSIRSGDRVTIVNRFGQNHTGRAVMRGPAGWVLNMGGKYGTPGIATNENIVKITPRKS